MDILQNAKELAGLIKALGNIELERRTLALQSEILELTSELLAHRTSRLYTINGNMNLQTNCPLSFYSIKINIFYGL